MRARLMQSIDGVLGLNIDPSDRMALVRARLLTFCPPIFGTFGCILVSLYANSPGGTATMVVVAGTASLLMLSTPLILYFTKSLRLAGWVTILACCAAIFPEPLFDLGFREPEIAIIVMLPVLAGLLISRQGSTLTYLATTAVMVIVLGRLLYWPPQELAALPAVEHIRFFFYSFAATTSAYVISLCFVWLFQNSLQDVEAAVARAEAASDAKTAFLANMSHELRTPINGILGFSRLTLNSKLNADERAWVSTIHSSGETLLCIVNDILDVSKLEAGALTIDNVDFELADVLDQVLMLNSQTAAEKNLHLGAVADAALPTLVRGDPGRLRQVLTNLIANAVKFTDSGGVILNITSRALNEGRCELRFEVVDTGIGIPEDKIPFLFDRFTQADASPSRRYGGSGLGLAICKDLVELMNGKLGVQSMQGRGSAFWFTVILQTMDGETATTYPVPASMNDRQVLVVGDPGIHRTIIERQLQAYGISFRFGDYGPNFQDLLASDDVGAVFFLDLPDDTKPLLAAFRRDEDNPHPRFIEIANSPTGFATDSGDDPIDLVVPAPLHHTCVTDALAQAFITSPKTHAPSPLAISDGSASGRILLAEDNVSNQLLFKTLLVNAGYTVDIVENGFEAIKAVRQQTYDLVLMDGQMPEMGGVEATRKIRNEGGPQSTIPIIALTANTMSGDREQYLKAGMNDYLAKPIDFDLFFEKVAQWAQKEQIDTKSA